MNDQQPAADQRTRPPGMSAWAAARGASARHLTRRPIWAGLFLALTLSAAGCAKGTYLEVRFVGPAALDIRAIRIELAVTPANGAAVQHSTDTVEPGGRITLPTSMAFKLDTESGNLDIAATALGPARLPLASDSATTTIKHGETWTITLRFGLTANSQEQQDLEDPPAPNDDGGR
ncbi:MAG: hypothetical protein ABUL77_01015 [Bacteroidota bacterium]